MPKSHEEDGHSADEEEPMLGTSGRSFDDAAASLKTATSKTDDNQAALWQELLRLIKLGIPLSTVSVLTFTANIVSLAYVGHLSARALAAAVLGTSLFNVTGFSILIGLSSAMETLCGQNFGAGNYSAIGIILQRSLLISAIVFAMIVALWTQIDRLLILLGQEVAISILAARYMRVMIPGLAFAAVNESLKRYLMAQNVVIPETIAMLVSTALSPLYNQILVVWAGFGLDGAAWAVNAVQLTSTIGIGGYIIWRERQLRGTEMQTWHGWSTKCLEGWRHHIAIAVPSLAMICVEWWAFEAIVLAAGLMPDAELSVAVVGVLLNIGAWIFMLPNGLSGAVSTRVSNELGAGFPLAARIAALVASLLALAIMLGIAAAVAAGRWAIADLLASDLHVRAAVAAVLPVLALATIGDGLNAVLSGVVRGCGRQLLGASINVCTYWLLGLPFAMILGFPVGLHVAGLWWGMAATTTLQGLTMGVVISRFNWETEASRARGRMDRDAHKPAKLNDVEQGWNAGAQASIGSGLTTGVVTLPVQQVQESQLAVVELEQRTP